MRTRLLVLSLSSTAGLALGAPALAAQSPLMLVPLRMDQVMSSDQFARAGIARLTPEQRLHLDGWLTRYSAELRQALEHPATSVAGSAPLSVRPVAANGLAASDQATSAEWDAADDQAAGAQHPRAVGWTVFSTTPLGARLIDAPEEGGYVRLADGTLWEIYLPDRTATVTWRNGDYITVSRAAAATGDFDHMLVNAPSNTRAYARFAGLVARRGRR